MSGVVRALVLLLVAAPLSAQRFDASALVVKVDHRLTSGVLVGGSAGFSFPIREGRVAPRLAVDYATGASDRTGVPCGGFIQPGTCAPEAIHDESRWLAVSGGVAIDLVRSERAALAVAGDGMIAPIRTRSRGLASGRRISASETMFGAMIGLEARWRPTLRAPLFVDAGFQVGTLAPILADDVVDGYTPFDQSINFRRVKVGLSVVFGNR